MFYQEDDKKITSNLLVSEHVLKKAVRRGMKALETLSKLDLVFLFRQGQE